MTEQTHFQTILFVDVTDSTPLYQQLGDEAAQELIGSLVSLIKDTIEAQDGRVIKTIGDEVMAEFSDPHIATETAVLLLQTTRQMAAEGDSPVPLKIKAGLHHGEVILKDGDVFGHTVNLAARIMGETKSGQILCTKEVINGLMEGLSPPHRLIDTKQLKGIDEPVEIHEIILPEDDATATAFVANESMPEINLQTTIQIFIGSQNQTFTKDDGKITLGRLPENKVVVSGEGVSRQHAFIEHKRGKFILVDQSINGTFILEPNEETIHLKRDESALPSSGELCLGHPDLPKEFRIRFEVS